jgi:hypothetical protein
MGLNIIYKQNAVTLNCSALLNDMYLIVAAALIIGPVGKS